MKTFEEFKAEIEKVFGHVPFSSHQNPGEDYIYTAIDTYTRMNLGDGLTKYLLTVKWSEGNFGHWRVAFGPVEYFGTSLRICAEEVRETLEQDARTLRLYLDALPQRAPAKPAEPAPTLESRVAALEATVKQLLTVAAPTIQPDLTVEPEWHRRPDEITDDRKRVWVVDVYQKIVAFLDEDDGVWLVYANLYGHDFLLYRGNARHAELIVRLCSRIPEVLL